MSDEHKRRWWPWVVLMLTLLVLYPLSVGPAFWLSDKLDPDAVEEHIVLEVMYLPLFAVVEAIGARDIMVEYLDWFVSH